MHSDPLGHPRRKGSRDRFVRSAAIGILLNVACAGEARHPAGSPAEARPLPSTPLVELDGTTVDLTGFLHGRAAILSLWATWCDGCAAEMGALRRLDAQAGALGDALVVGVAVGEDRAKVARFVRNHGIPYAQLVDEHFALADTLEERSIPATLVVDRQGRIVHRGGSLDAASLAAFRRAAAAGDARASAAAASHPVNPSPAQSSAAPE